MFGILSGRAARLPALYTDAAERGRRPSLSVFYSDQLPSHDEIHAITDPSRGAAVGALTGWDRPGRVLLCIAAPVEAAAVLKGRGLGATADPGAPAWRPVELADRLDLLVTGIGKANAAAGAATILHQRRHACAISLGLAGALPGAGLSPGAAVLASACIYADEGILTPEGLVDCESLGFPLGPFPGNAVPVDAALSARLRPLADAHGPIATVSACSGTNDAARIVRERTGALAEGMEGAAIAHIAARLGLGAAELRIISNTTGDRAAQFWDLAGALERLEAIARSL